MFIILLSHNILYVRHFGIKSGILLCITDLTRMNVLNSNHLHHVNCLQYDLLNVRTIAQITSRSSYVSLGHYPDFYYYHHYTSSRTHFKADILLLL